MRLRHSLRDTRGQTLVEFAMVLPLLIVVAFGVVEFGYMLLDQHVVTKMTREGSNLISRNTTLGDAATVMRNMSTRPVNFDANSKLIFSVIRNVSTVGAPNYNTPVLYERYEYGTLARYSTLNTRGPATFGNPPEYQAPNSDSNTNLQVTNLPANIISLGGMLYVTEIYTQHPRLTPLQNFGITIPSVLYSIAYF
ncbi:MAG TPA: TadE family protein [Casimicrobiaceae bacterium]|nr:TadE family protein [Casimicrobiaceae bacterium]